MKKLIIAIFISASIRNIVQGYHLHFEFFLQTKRINILNKSNRLLAEYHKRLQRHQQIWTEYMQKANNLSLYHLQNQKERTKNNQRNLIEGIVIQNQGLILEVNQYLDQLEEGISLGVCINQQRVLQFKEKFSYIRNNIEDLYLRIEKTYGRWISAIWKKYFNCINKQKYNQKFMPITMRKHVSDFPKKQYYPLQYLILFYTSCQLKNDQIYYLNSFQSFHRSLIQLVEKYIQKLSKNQSYWNYYRQKSDFFFSISQVNLLIKHLQGKGQVIYYLKENIKFLIQGQQRIMFQIGSKDQLIRVDKKLDWIMIQVVPIIKTLGSQLEKLKFEKQQKLLIPVQQNPIIKLSSYTYKRICTIFHTLYQYLIAQSIWVKYFSNSNERKQKEFQY